jgi:tetratricopeptide (TPR) repeat protein
LPGAHDAYLRGRGFLYRYDKAGNLERAGQQFEEAIRADPKFAAAHVGLAETHLRAYRTRKDPALLDAARNQAQRARELSPQLASARVILGGVLAESRQQQEAVRELEAAIQLDPREPAAYRELARLYWSLARYRDAEQLYQKAIAARPGDWMTYSFAARFYVTWQHYQEAERYFRKAIELTPDNPDAYRNLGGLLAKLGREREAEAMMLKAQTLNPIATGYSNLATLYMLQGRYKDAVPMAEQAAALAAQMPKAYLIWGNLGDAYWLARADPAKAREAWRKAAQIAQEEAARAPADTIILSYLAKYQAKLGDAPGALQRLEAARRQAPDNGAVRYQAGLAYALLGKNDPALRELAAALDRKFPVEEVQKAPELAPLREDPRYQQLIAQAVKRKGN